MKRCIVGGLAAVLMAGGLIVSPPPAGAGLPVRRTRYQQV
jgi:hypothetical protein